MFFDRSARSTRRIRFSRRRANSSLSNARDALALRDAPRRAVVDRQRVGADPHLAVLEVHGAALEVDLEVHQVVAALQEVVGGRNACGSR